MPYMENKNGEVVLTMDQQDYEVLLMALGSAIAVSKDGRGVPMTFLIPVLNRLMEGNPQWTPYGERSQ